METKLDLKRILIFLAFAFGFSWTVGLILFLISNGTLFSGGTSQLTGLLAGTVYMMGPALANVFTRLVTREGWKDTFLRPNFRRGWKFWLLAWISPVVVTLAGAAVYFLVFPQYFDATMPAVAVQFATIGRDFNMSPWLFAGTQVINALVVGLLINSWFTFGEEFGWRAYLLQKLALLGPRKAVLVLGVIWGVWHWPLTAQGHNYGLNYPGAPWLGMLVMVVFTTGFGIILSWMALRAGSVWPAVIGHAIANGVGAIGMLWVVGSPNLLIGPYPPGLLGGSVITLIAAILLLWPGALRPAD
jgi:membrane protease YdiL (CAAX protease family)